MKRSKLDLSGVVILVGNYGSGKTEVAINLAIHHRQLGKQVQIADLDLVNPYFRTREAVEVLTQLGVDVVAPKDEWRHADLPLLSPQIGGLIRAPQDLVILDVGGNNVGATVLAALADHFKGVALSMLQVVNPFRPFTETIDGCQKIRQEIESAAGMSITGIIGNPNLLDETNRSDLERGYRFLCDLSEADKLPFELMAVAQKLYSSLKEGEFNCPLLPLLRQLVPPWRRAASVNSLFSNLG